jgi:hypothetical protein
VFTERYDTPGGGTQPNGYDDQAVIESAWKLRRVDVDGPGPLAAQDLAYYLPTDPNEQRPAPIATLPPALRARLLSEMASVPARQ